MIHRLFTTLGITSLISLLLIAGCSDNDSTDPDEASDIDTAVAKVVTALDELAIEYTEPVRRNAGGSGAKASFDITINGFGSYIHVFEDGDDLAQWQNLSDSFGAIHVAFDNSALALNFEEGIADAAEIAPQIAEAIGGEAHGV